MKICSKCNITKDLGCFGKAKQNKDGLNGQCKDCRAAYLKEYYSQNKEQVLAHNREYYQENKEEIIEQKIEYRAMNLESIQKKTNVRLKKKRKTDPQFKLASNLRGRLNMAIKREYRAGSAVKDLGCSIESFKTYIESLFTEGMSWENYGPKGWHLDHKLPLDSFDLTDREQFLKACHYTNIQPLWAIDNFKKGSKIYGQEAA
jgi:hypothetical protein